VGINLRFSWNNFCVLLDYFYYSLSFKSTNCYTGYLRSTRKSKQVSSFTLIIVFVFMRVVFHFNLSNIYFSDVWNKPFPTDNSLSVIHSVEVMSDHVSTWIMSVIQCFSCISVIVFCLSFGVALCVPVELFCCKWGKNDQIKGLDLLVMFRGITEGNQLQKM